MIKLPRRGGEEASSASLPEKRKREAEGSSKGKKGKGTGEKSAPSAHGTAEESKKLECKAQGDAEQPQMVEAVARSRQEEAGLTVRLPKPVPARRPPPRPSPKDYEAVVDKLQKKDVYMIFAEPVTEEVAPGYFSIIKEPMDFATIRKKVNAETYDSFQGLLADLELMLRNAMTYNDPSTIFYKEAGSLLALARKAVAHAEKKWSKRVAIGKTDASGLDKANLSEKWATVAASDSTQEEDDEKGEEASAPVKMTAKAAAANEIKERLAQIEHINRHAQLKRKQRNLGALHGGANPEGIPWTDKVTSMVPQRVPLPIDCYVRSACRFAAKLSGKAKEICLAKALPFLPWDHSSGTMLEEQAQALSGRLPSSATKEVAKHVQNEPVPLFDHPLLGICIGDDKKVDNEEVKGVLGGASSGTKCPSKSNALIPGTDTASGGNLSEQPTEEKVNLTSEIGNTEVVMPSSTDGSTSPSNATHRPVPASITTTQKKGINGQSNGPSTSKKHTAEEKKKSTAPLQLDTKNNFFQKQYNQGRSSSHLLVQQLQPNIPFKLQSSMNLKTEESKRAVLAAVQKLQAYQSGVLQGQGQKK